MSFKSELDDDLSSVFLNNKEFAESVLVTPKSGSPVPYNIDGIFDEAYELVDPGSEANVSAVRPVLQVKSTVTTLTIVQEDTVNIRTVDYQVTDVQPDGVGILLLILNLK